MSRKGFVLFIIFTLMMNLFGCQANQNDNPNEKRDEDTATVRKDLNKLSLKPDDPVVTINQMTHNYGDLTFTELVSKVEIELNRLQDEKTLQGEKLRDKLAYWDEQLKYYDNYNVNLSRLIELYAMYLLAQEKGLRVEQQEVERTIDDFQAKINDSEQAKKLIADSKMNDFENRLTSYLTHRLLAEQIYNILKEDVKKENPKAVDKEIAYLANQKYEELYQSQIESLDITVH